jgi:hypothetical protein
MKIGMLTPHCARNYGGVLQAYALQTVLSQLGHDPQIVNLIPPSRRKDSVFSLPWQQGPKAWANNLLVLLQYSATRRRMARFAEFDNNFLRLSAKEYHSFGEIQEDPPRCDAYVCGSDQLWRPGMHAFDTIRAYLMDFVRKEEAPKIAYAPSFGLSSLTDEYKQTIRPLLDDFTHLSIREKTGQTLIEEITGRQVPIVLDPTLLLKAEHWNSLEAPPRVKPPYILVYCQSQRRNFYDLVSKIKKSAKLPVVVISLLPYNRIPGADHVLYDVSFQEYMGLFAHAACVCTNSFHGTAFSLTYQRPFWTASHESANSRMADLLAKVGLSSRQLGDAEPAPRAPLEIDYSKAEGLLDEARRESMNYLKNALAGA